MNITKTITTCKLASAKLLNSVVSNSFLAKENTNTKSIILIQKQRFNLASFYLLIQSSIKELHMFCSCKFLGNAINEILQNLSIKLQNHNFGKLISEVDSNAKNITLNAPTHFIKDWIQNQYLQLINTIYSVQNYDFIRVSI